MGTKYAIDIRCTSGETITVYGTALGYANGHASYWSQSLGVFTEYNSLQNFYFTENGQIETPTPTPSGSVVYSNLSKTSTAAQYIGNGESLGMELSTGSDNCLSSRIKFLTYYQYGNEAARASFLITVYPFGTTGSPVGGAALYTTTSDVLYTVPSTTFETDLAYSNYYFLANTNYFITFECTWTSAGGARVPDFSQCGNYTGQGFNNVGDYVNSGSGWSQDSPVSQWQIEIDGATSAVTASAAISTTGVTVGANGTSVILQGVVDSLGSDGSLQCGFLWGYTSAYEEGESTEQIVTGIGVGTGNGDGQGDFYYQIESPTLGATIYYEAIAWSANQGAYVYGAPLTYLVPASGLQTGVDIQTITAKNVTYTTADLGYQLVSLGTFTNATSLDFLVSSKADMSFDTEINIATGTIFASNTPSYVTAGGLTSGTTYYFQAVVTVNGAPYYGNIQTFLTASVSGGVGGGGGAVIGKVNNWLTSHGMSTAWWWVIILVLMGIPWVFPFMREHSMVPLIFDVVILGAGIALVLDVWIVVLLALGAGAVIWLVMRGKG